MKHKQCQIRTVLRFVTLLFTLSLVHSFAFAQRPAAEEDYYRLVTLPIPEDIKLEVGGLAPLPDGRLAACTRRGDVWIISNPYMQGSRVPTFKKFASVCTNPLV